MDYVFPTRAAAIAGAAAGLDALLTLGDNAAGDLGGARYRRVPAEPAHPGKFQDGRGQWWELCEHNVNVQMFGGTVSLASVLDVTTSFQKAVDYANAKEGATVRLTPGFHGVNGTVVIAKGLVIEGSGRGLATGTGNSGGTVVRKLDAAGHVFHVKSVGAVTIRDMTIDTQVTHTDANGAGVFVEGDNPASRDNYNTNSLFDNLTISGLQNGLRIRAAINWTLRDSLIMDFRSIGVYLSGEGSFESNGDDCTGHSRVQDCVIWAFTTLETAQACVRYDCGGDFRILGSKLLGSQFGLRLALNRGATGTLLMTGNSFEQQTVACAYVQQTAASATFGNLVVVGNQFSIIAPPSSADPQGTIIVTAGSSTSWIRNIVISGNVVNHAYAPSVDRATFAIDGGSGVVIDSNVINFNGTSSHHFGIAVGVATSDVTIGYGNKVLGLMSPGRKFASLAANTKVFDGDGVSFATLPAVAEGSLIYVSDGAKGSPPALAGSSTGAAARRLGSAWYV